MLYLGDAVYGQSLAPFVDKFNRERPANLNLVKSVDDPSRFGVAPVEGDRMTKLVEKPQEPESNLAMAGMYVFGPELWSVLPYLKPSGRGEYEITDAIQLLIDNGETVLAGVYEGEWFDTGTLPSFLETSRFLTRGETLIDPSAIVKGEVGKNVVVGADVCIECGLIEDSVVLPDAEIRCSGEIVGSLLGGRATAQEFRDAIVYGDLK
jgi:glucose-1-phosphate thymidylyltransferase